MHTIVVGAGIAGLWIAEQLALRGDRVTVLEKADYLGGRILTSRLGFEIGAGRIATNHIRVMALAKRFGLTTFPLPSGELWKGLADKEMGPRPNDFDETWGALTRLFAPLTLGKTTLRQLAEQTVGTAMADSILLRFGFRAETDVLRADLALRAFHDEMGPTAKFVGIKGGLSQLTAGLADACKAAGVTIQLNTTVKNVTGSDTFTVHTTAGPLRADRVIFALPSEALKKIPQTRELPLLRHLKMEPLTRIYAKFATAWPFPTKIVTDSPLRFIIPIISELGLVMISYTESQDTKHFKGISGLMLAAAIHKELARLFPTDNIPLILWVHAYEWSEGCSYWIPTPGTYSPAQESKEALQPFPGRRLHLCGESFSLRQAWMEGALEHAQALLDTLI